MKSYASFALWKKDQSAKNQKLISALERVVKDVAPQLSKTVKWGQGCFVDGTKPKAYLHGAVDHVQLGFYNGASLKDPKHVLNGKGKYVRHIKVSTLKDIDQKAFSALLLQVTK